MTDTNGSSQVKLGWGDKSLALRGSMVILVVLLVALGVMFIHFQDVQSEGHTIISERIEMQTCILSLSPEERVELRGSLAGIRKVETADFYIRAWCPWIGR
ncbi:MAG: hypothetical protein ACRDI2_09945 [Chloroflexota bacterium]